MDEKNIDSFDISDEDLFQIYEMLNNLAETSRVGVLDVKLISSVFKVLSKYEKEITENDIIDAWKLYKIRLQGNVIEEETVSKNALEISDLLILIDFVKNYF